VHCFDHQPAEVWRRLRCDELSRTREVHVQGSCAVTGDGIYEGIDWLIEALRRNGASLPSVKRSNVPSGSSTDRTSAASSISAAPKDKPSKKATTTTTPTPTVAATTTINESKIDESKEDEAPPLLIQWLMVVDEPDDTFLADLKAYANIVPSLILLLICCRLRPMM
jgi:hypothetical protein